MHTSTSSDSLGSHHRVLSKSVVFLDTPFADSNCLKTPEHNRLVSLFLSNQTEPKNRDSIVHFSKFTRVIRLSLHVIHLHIDYCRFSSYEVVTHLPLLTTLTFSRLDTIPKCDYLTRAPSLSTLNLEFIARIDDLTPLEMLTNIVSLEIIHCGSLNLSHLPRLTHLRSLSLCLNNLSLESLSPLTKLTQLEHLKLGENLPNLTPFFDEFTKLVTLDLTQSDTHKKLTSESDHDIYLLKEKLPSLEVITFDKVNASYSEPDFGSLVMCPSEDDGLVPSRSPSPFQHTGHIDFSR